MSTLKRPLHMANNNLHTRGDLSTLAGANVTTTAASKLTGQPLARNRKGEPIFSTVCVGTHPLAAQTFVK